MSLPFLSEDQVFCFSPTEHIALQGPSVGELAVRQGPMELGALIYPDEAAERFPDE